MMLPTFEEGQRLGAPALLGQTTRLGSSAVGDVISHDRRMDDNVMPALMSTQRQMVYRLQRPSVCQQLMVVTHQLARLWRSG
jgi:hypothetical protein